MKKFFLIFLSLILGAIMISSGISMLVYGFALENRFELTGLIFLMIGIWPLVFAFKQISFGRYVKKHIEILEKHQSVDPVNISVFIQEFGLSEKKTIAAISSLIYYGYVNRITIDYAHKKIIYLDSSSAEGDEKTNFIYIKCPACGGTNHVVKGQKYFCEYCGTELQSSGTTENIKNTSNKSYSNAEIQVLKENLKIAYLTPVYFIPVFILILSLSSVFEALFEGELLSNIITILINVLILGTLSIKKVRTALLKILLKLRNDENANDTADFWNNLNLFKKAALLWATLSIPLSGIMVGIGYILPNNNMANSIGAFYLVGFPLGVFSIQGIYSGYGIVMAKYLRPLKAKYLALIVHMRNYTGTPIRSIANVLNESEKITEKNLNLLIKTNHLKGVSIKNSKIFYLDDNIKFDRFVSVKCDMCYGESVATYGKSNNCPYCGNPLLVPPKK